MHGTGLAGHAAPRQPKKQMGGGIKKMGIG
jgi:hypothetical protein